MSGSNAIEPPPLAPGVLGGDSCDQALPVHSQVSEKKKPTAPNPLKRCSWPDAWSYAMAEKARPLKLLGSVRPTWVQLLPLQVQVSFRKFVPSNPPKSTS